jgi:hypothetical protein
VQGSRKDGAKRKTWLATIERFKSSGLSQARFCEREGVPVKRFVYWYRRYRDGKLTEAVKPQVKRAKQARVMLPVTVASAPGQAASGSGGTVEIFVVRVSADASEESLRRIFACLARPSC